MSTELHLLYIQWYGRNGHVSALWFRICSTTQWWTVLWQVFCLSINQEKLLQSCTVFRFLRLLNDESPLPTFTVNGCFFTTCADFAGLTCTWSRPSIFSRIEPALQRLDWHSVHFKIIFEIAILMYLYKNCSTSSLSSEPSTPIELITFSDRGSIVDVAYGLQPPELPSFSADTIRSELFSFCGLAGPHLGFPQKIFAVLDDWDHHVVLTLSFKLVSFLKHFFIVRLLCKHEYFYILTFIIFIVKLRSVNFSLNKYWIWLDYGPSSLCRIWTTPCWHQSQICWIRLRRKDRVEVKFKISKLTKWIQLLYMIDLFAAECPANCGTCTDTGSSTRCRSYGCDDGYEYKANDGTCQR